MTEEEHTFHFEVTVRAFGYTDKARNDALLTLARNLWHGFRDQATIWIDGAEYLLDPKGDDMGHHPGHDTPLIKKNGAHAE